MIRKALVALSMCLSMGPALAATTSTATLSSGTTFVAASSPLGGIDGCGISGTGSPRSYGLSASFTTGDAGQYAFEVVDVTPFLDSFLAVYSAPFNPANPTANLVGCNDDGNGGGQGLNSKFIANLAANTTYYAMGTSYGGGTQNGVVITFQTGLLPTITLADKTVALGTTGQSMVATSNSPGAITYSSGDTSVATIDANTGALTIVGPGTVQITATQAAVPAPSLFTSGQATATLTVPNVQPPGAPTGLSVFAGNGTGAVSFAAPASDGGAPITSFTVTCTSSDGGASGTATGARAPITVTGLTNDKTYTCTVAATNSAGTGAASVASATFVPTAGQPIPTLSEWVMMLLAGLIGIVAYGSLRRRQF